MFTCSNVFMLDWFQFTTIYLGPIPIQVWGFFVALGMVLFFFILMKGAIIVGITKEEIVDHAFWIILIGIVGARLVHVLLYQPHYFIEHPQEIIAVWHGGLSSFGGLIGASIG